MKKHVFSAPGRTEIGGNHTDHQHGCVLADATKAKELLGWEATHTVEDMCRSSWEFARKSAE